MIFAPRLNKPLGEFPYTEDFVALFEDPSSVHQSTPGLEAMLDRTARTGLLPAGVDPSDKRVVLIRDALMATTATRAAA